MRLSTETGPQPRPTPEYRKTESSYAELSLPDAWNRLLAEPTLAPVEMDRVDGEAGALHHCAAAFRAPGTLGRMAGNIADIHVMQTFGVADGLGAFQRGHGGGRKVLQKVFGME